MSLELERIHLPADRLSADDLRHMHELAGRHSDPQDIGSIALLDVNPELYPAQGAFCVDGQKQTAEVLDMLATQIEPAYPDVFKRLINEQSAGLENIWDLLADGKNVVVALPHGPLTDIGVSLAAVHNGLLHDNPERQFRTAIIVSLTLQMMGVRFGRDTVEAPEALGYLCDQVYFSVPRTSRVGASQFARAVQERRISAHNTAMLQDLTARLDDGGVLLAIAPSGTTDTVLEDGTHLMAPLTGGTIKLLQHSKTFIQPVAAKLEGLSQPVFELCGEPRLVTGAGDAHGVMNDIAAGLSSQGGGIRFIYDDPRRAR